MAFWRWGDAHAAHLVVCVHGLTRQGRDFDQLAQALVAQSPHPVQVICPDVVGRGRSDWLADPMGYVDKDDIHHAIKAIVATQRDYGRRDDRKQARPRSASPKP